MCYAYIVPSRYDQLDELLTRIHIARQRPSWRRRLLDAPGPVTNVSTLRVLRAVEQCETVGGRAPPSAMSPSTWPSNTRPPAASVATVVAAGLLTKATPPTINGGCALVLTDAGRKALADGHRSAPRTGRRDHRRLARPTSTPWSTLLDRLHRTLRTGGQRDDRRNHRPAAAARRTRVDVRPRLRRAVLGQDLLRRRGVDARHRRGDRDVRRDALGADGRPWSVSYSSRRS